MVVHRAPAPLPKTRYESALKVAVARMRADGLTFDSIAIALDISRSQAVRMYRIETAAIAVKGN